MSVTGNRDDPIPHGLKGYRKPWCCRCAICKDGNAEYHRNRRAERAKAGGDVVDMAAQRSKRNGKRTESRDSVASKRIGRMERAVIDECELLDEAKKRPTVVVAARNLARLIDDLSDGTEGGSVQVSTTKQLMTLLDTLRPKDIAETGKKRTGSRLATVGQLTKVKRA